MIIAGLLGGEDDAPKHADELAGQVRDLGLGEQYGVTVRTGGIGLMKAEATEQIQHDLLRTELIALPLCFLALVWVFGGLLTAAVPMAVGLMAIVGSMSLLRLITHFADASIFALNLTVALGLALAVDYTLLIISRYRDELADGAEPDHALVVTMFTAGRTVLFSAAVVALSMSVMIIFPTYFLKSFAYAGIATVAFAAAAAILVTPAAIALLGEQDRRLRRKEIGAESVSAARARDPGLSRRRSGTGLPRSSSGTPFRSACRRWLCCCFWASRSSASSGATRTTG